MKTISKLKQAVSTIETAKRRLKSASYDVDDDYDIKKAIKELDGAEADIQRAIRDLK